LGLVTIPRTHLYSTERALGEAREGGSFLVIVKPILIQKATLRNRGEGGGLSASEEENNWTPLIVRVGEGREAEWSTLWPVGGSSNLEYLGEAKTGGQSTVLY